MANITGTVQDIQTSRIVNTPSPSWVKMNDGFAAAVAGTAGIIQPVGVIDVGGSDEVSGTTTTLYLVHTVHAIATYEVLATTPTTGVVTTDQATANTNLDSPLEEWATNDGLMNGKSINAGQTMDFSISARRESGTSEDAHLELEFFHRAADTTETLIATIVLADLTTSYQDFTGTWSVSSDQAFASNDLLVLKIILYNDGVPA